MEYVLPTKQEILTKINNLKNEQAEKEVELKELYVKTRELNDSLNNIKEKLSENWKVYNKFYKKSVYALNRCS